VFDYSLFNFREDGVIWCRGFDVSNFMVTKLWVMLMLYTCFSCLGSYVSSESYQLCEKICLGLYGQTFEEEDISSIDTNFMVTKLWVMSC